MATKKRSVHAKKKGNKKVTAAIRLRMNRDVLQNELITNTFKVEQLLFQAHRNETISYEELTTLTKRLSTFQRVADQLFYVPRVGHEVSVKTSYLNDNVYWHDGYIQLVNDAGVWLEGSNDEDLWGPFDPNTGVDLRTEEDPFNHGQIYSIVYDYGYESQHFEDVFLGEGDTL